MSEIIFLRRLWCGGSVGSIGDTDEKTSETGVGAHNGIDCERGIDVDAVCEPC